MSVQRLAERIGRWAESRLLPGTLVVLLITDIAAALNWLLSPDSDLTAPWYDVAKRLAPLDVWAGLFLGLGVAAAAVIVARGSRHISGYIVGGLLAGLWGWWTVLFGLGATGRADGSYFAAIVAASLCGLHLLSGLALTYRSPWTPPLGGLSRDRRVPK